LPDDLLGTVALDPGGAAVPGRHDAIDVEHEDRILAHPLDQQAKALLAVPQALLVLAPLGQVARDFRKSDQLLVATVERGDDDVRPEARPILLDAPALVLEASLRRSDSQLVRREIERLRRIEPAEVLPDDLRSAVALDPLGPGVPGEDPALGIEHEDGIVPNALHEKAKPLLALAERFIAIRRPDHACCLTILFLARDANRTAVQASGVPSAGYFQHERVKASPAQRSATTIRPDRRASRS